VVCELERLEREFAKLYLGIWVVAFEEGRIDLNDSAKPYYYFVGSLLLPTWFDMALRTSNPCSYYPLNHFAPRWREVGLAVFDFGGSLAHLTRVR
jgi:hypothetical protein